VIIQEGNRLMVANLELQVGTGPWPVSIPPAKAVALERAPIPPLPSASPREQVRTALEAPFGFEPLRRALTPDDHVAIVLDADLPHAAELLAAVLDHLGTAGIGPAAVTVITPPGARQGWIDELPDEFADLTAETHDPGDRKKLAYLASTKAGRRLYLNRTLVEADFVILLTGRGYDPLTGYAGAEAAVFPALADDESRAAYAGQYSTGAPGGEPWPVQVEAAEVVHLLGMPFLVQVIEGAGGAIQEVVAGLPASAAEGARRQDARWRGTIARDQRPQLVIATITGDPRRVTFLDIAKAAACAAQVVKPVSKGGRIAVLTEAAPALGDGVQLLRSMDDTKGARKRLAQEKPDDWAAAWLWAAAAMNQRSLFLASGYPDEVAEELFTTPVHSAGEIQRLIDAAESVLVVPDAHRSMVTTDQ
jgi:nickel-dependent lactate racemase